MVLDNEANKIIGGKKDEDVRRSMKERVLSLVYFEKFFVKSSTLRGRVKRSHRRVS